MPPMRPLLALAAVAVLGCDDRVAVARPVAAAVVAQRAAVPAGDPLAGFVARHTIHRDLASAIALVLRDQPRVVGIGELHERTDRAATARPALVRFADELLPPLATQVSDLVLETWTMAPGCATAAQNTRQIEQSMRRPAATAQHITNLFGITKANAITAHAMRLTCEDLAAAVTADGVDGERLLGLVTRELGRITASAVRYRDERQETRPLILVYGGALHNDLYPPRSTREWSYALDVDRATGGRFVELDLFRPEQIEDNELYQGEPWYPLLAKAGPDRVVLIERAPHSYVAILPREP
jgi:hypothetical protein